VAGPAAARSVRSGLDLIARRAVPGQRGAAATASSALILCARALSASLQPLTPLLRRARRDTGFPAAASLRPIRRAWSTCCCAARGSGLVVRLAALWSWTGAILVPAGGPGPGQRLAASGLVWIWPGPVPGGPGCGWSSGRVVRCARSGVGSKHVGQRSPHGQDQNRQGRLPPRPSHPRAACRSAWLRGLDLIKERPPRLDGLADGLSQGSG